LAVSGTARLVLRGRSRGSRFVCGPQPPAAAGPPPRPSGYGIPMAQIQGSILGNPVKRREDPRLITGAGLYVADVKLEGALFAHFVRSPYAHATINGVDSAAARAMPGVVAVFTAEDLGLAAQ